VTRAVVVVLAGVLAACGKPSELAPGPAHPLPAFSEAMIDTTPKQRRRLLPPEVYLSAYLTWFGGLVPLDVQTRARGRNMFDAWDDYLAALGLPDHRIDLPRATQSNTLMLATLGRLGEALCVRAAEHDLHNKQQPAAVFDFANGPVATLEDFTPRFDVLHRTFLGYPVALAPAGRAARFFQLWQQVAAHHPKKQPLDASEMAWAAVCTALVQHPETELY
jgi:hypothetical protein